jgi:enoyl-CoA hydratase/carnithine racemase
MLLHNMPKPVIAAVNGAASGLGADTAMACDFIIANEWANFSWSYIHRGIIADGGGMYFLPRRVGLVKAKELIFTGRKVDIDEALSLGIADRKTTADRLLADAQAWAAELAALPTVAVGYMKQNLNTALRGSLADVMDIEAPNMIRTFETQDHKGAALAFVEKRAPQFKGC